MPYLTDCVIFRANEYIQLYLKCFLNLLFREFNDFLGFLHYTKYKITFYLDHARKAYFCSGVLNGVSRHLDESSPGWNIFDEVSQHLDIGKQMKSSSNPPLYIFTLTSEQQNISR